MPIGVPRIIYSWGEELPAQWTDIYNFIFRRRMVFLMQYLDDELCNQICGLLINIHMEDRSKELEKNEMEGDSKPRSTSKRTDSPSAVKKNRSPEDLLNASEDLGIDEIDTLEQLTLQKITKEWLNWNSQFFDYSDEPYLYYLAQTLSKDFGNSSSRSPYDFNAPQFFNSLKSNSLNLQNQKTAVSGKGLDIYSAFRTSLSFENEGAGKYSLNDMHPLLKGSPGQRNVKKDQLLQMFKQGSNAAYGGRKETMKNKGIAKFLLDLAGKEFKSNSSNSQEYKNLSVKALGQRQLRREYNLNSLTSQIRHPQNKKAWTSSTNDSYSEFRDYYRKQTERSFMEEESKKVFVIINSFGGSVGNGITVHDALQFIKAGSLTLGLGVAASASSLVLAGGTIGERYVTEGCHTMIHQPECLSPDHEVLTTRGWIPIAEVTTNDKVAVLKEGKYLDYEHPTKTHTYKYKGDMYKVQTKGLNLFVTPEHRMYVATSSLEENQPENYGFKQASDILHKKVRYLKSAIWRKDDYKFNLPEVSHNTSKGINPNTNSRTITDLNNDAFLRFLGMWIAEGWTRQTSPDEPGYEPGKVRDAVCISQKKPEGCQYLEKCIEDLGLVANQTTPSENDQNSGATSYVINNKQLCSFLDSFILGARKFFSKEKNFLDVRSPRKFFSLKKIFYDGLRTSNKRLPDFVWELSSRQCALLLEGLIVCDGHVNKNDGTRYFFTSSLHLAKDVSRLIFHAGFTCTYGLETAPSSLDNTRNIKGRDIKSDGPLYRVNVINEKGDMPYSNYDSTRGDFNDELVPYEGNVHCVTVPSGVFYVQKDGVPVWTGNSSLQGQASDIWIDSQEIMKIRLDVADIYSLSTYRPRHKILRDLDRDFYLNAPETISYGLADEIATNEVMSEIVEMTSKIWDVYDSKQQRLLESRESATAGSETQTQS